MPPLIHGLSVSSEEGVEQQEGIVVVGKTQHSFGCEFSKSRVDMWALTRSEQLTVAGQETGKLWDLKPAVTITMYAFDFSCFSCLLQEKGKMMIRDIQVPFSGPHR